MSYVKQHFVERDSPVLTKDINKLSQNAYPIIYAELQPVTSWYLIHCMTQYRINIRIHFIC